MLELMDRLFNKHKLVRRLLVVWAICLITWVTVRVFSDLTLITSAVNAALGMITAILTTVIAHYQWSRGRDNAGMDNE